MTATMGERRFYWLKLKNDFFEQKEIKKLRRIAGGDTFTIIYLKMQLLSLKSDGKLFFDCVEDTFAEELALTLDETPENIEMTLSFLRKHELIEQVESDEYILPETVKSIGSEGSSAQRMRRLRTKASQCDGLLSQGDSSVTKSDVEIEIEREIEKEKEKDIVLPGGLSSTYHEVINHLNERASTQFKATSKDTQKLIRARLNEGFVVADFIKVVDNKCEDWLEDPKMVKFLRPITLFGTKFEAYLNERSQHGKQNTAGNTGSQAKRNAEDARRRWGLSYGEARS